MAGNKTCGSGRTSRKGFQYAIQYKGLPHADSAITSTNVFPIDVPLGFLITPKNQKKDTMHVHFVGTLHQLLFFFLTRETEPKAMNDALLHNAAIMDYHTSCGGIVRVCAGPRRLYPPEKKRKAKFVHLFHKRFSLHRSFFFSFGVERTGEKNQRNWNQKNDAKEYIIQTTIESLTIICTTTPFPNQAPPLADANSPLRCLFRWAPHATA